VDMRKFNPENVPEKKISATLWKFAEPLIKQIDERTTKEQIEKGMIMLVTIWNAATQDELNKNNEYLTKLRQSMKNAAALQLLDSYVSRKKYLFRNDLRMISDFGVTCKDGYLRIEAKGTVDKRILNGLKKH